MRGHKALDLLGVSSAVGCLGPWRKPIAEMLHATVYGGRECPVGRRLASLHPYFAKLGLQWTSGDLKKTLVGRRQIQAKLGVWSHNWVGDSEQGQGTTHTILGQQPTPHTHTCTHTHTHTHTHTKAGLTHDSTASNSFLF